MNLSDLLQTLADPLRLRIVNLLAASPLCVQHLQTALDRDQVTVSKQLLIMKARGLVVSEKMRTWRLYRLSPNPSKTVRRLLACLQTIVGEEELYREDLARLADLDLDVRTFLKPKSEVHLKKKKQLPAPAVTAQQEQSTPMEDHLL
jgi:ArsR family transcriptional regulator